MVLISFLFLDQSNHIWSHMIWPVTQQLQCIDMSWTTIEIIFLLLAKWELCQGAKNLDLLEWFALLLQLRQVLLHLPVMCLTKTGLIVLGAIPALYHDFNFTVCSYQLCCECILKKVKKKRWNFPAVHILVMNFNVTITLQFKALAFF